MKKLLFIVIAVFVLLTTAKAQNYSMSNSNVSTCSGNFYDSGGAGGDYTNNQNLTMTFCSSTPGAQISFHFTLFNAESLDHLIVHDGPNATSPTIGNYSGYPTVPFTVTSSNGCLTFVWTSDISVVYAGWAATISCIIVPGFNMGGPTNVSACSGHFYDSGGSGTNYGNNENSTMTFCSSVTGQEVVITFSSFNLAAGDVLTAYNGPSTGSPVLGTYTGNTIPAAVGSTSGCVTFAFTSNAAGTGTGWSANITCISGGTSCAVADPFCTAQGMYTYPAGVNNGTAEVGANYGCLYSEPNPAWYYLNVANSGPIEIEMHSTPQNDIDFACWGPFTTPTSACVAQLTAGTGAVTHWAPGPSASFPSLNMIDCSYSASWQEWCYIPNAISGQYYILLITNFSNSACNINFSQLSGSGSTNCAIMAPAGGDTVCAGQTINLIVPNSPPGATFAWTGPGNFTANTMNVSRPNATVAMAGSYTLIMTVNGVSSPPAGYLVLVNPNPAITIAPTNPMTCPGAPITLTPTSTVTNTWYNWSNQMQGSGAITVSPMTPTTYTVTGTSTWGCTGTASIAVGILPNLTIGVTPTSAAICLGTSTTLTASGGTSYTWTPSATLNTGTGATVTASPTTQTTYTVVGTTSTCTGSTTVTVSINPNLVISVNPAAPSICIGTSISLAGAGGTTYTWTPSATLSSGTGTPVTATPLAATTYTVVGANANGCTGSTTVTVSINPNLVISVTPANPMTCPGDPEPMTGAGADTYVWSPSASLSDSVGTTVNAAPLVATTYTVVGTNAAGCTGSTTVHVAMNPDIVISVTPSNPSTCPGDPIALSGVGATTYVWTPSNTLSDSVGTVVSASPLVATTYTVVGNANGCTGSTTVTVAMNPDIIVTSTPIAICIGTSGVLTASGGDTYIWTPSNTLNVSTGATVTASPIVTTTYTVTGNASGCTGSTGVTVTVFPAPLISIVSTPPDICPGDTSELTTSFVSPSYSWLPTNGLTSPNTQTTLASPSATTTYTLVANNNGCVSTAEYTLVVNPLPTVSFTADIREGCQGLRVNFEDLTTPAVGAWHWTFGDNIIYGNSSALQDPFHYFASAGTYDISLSVVTIDGCTMGVTYPGYIITHPVPVADFSVTPEIVNELDPLVWFTDQSVGADIWNWSFGESNVIGNNSSLQNPTHIYSDTGMYYPSLIVFSDYGCSDTTSRQVYVEPNFAFYIPNAFTPNSDEKNQKFAPLGEGINLETFEMRIYNRWGEQVCYTRDMANGWDGKIKGKVSEQGVYSWYISFYDINRKYHAYKGSVILIR